MPSLEPTEEPTPESRGPYGGLPIEARAVLSEEGHPIYRRRYLAWRACMQAAGLPFEEAAQHE